MDTNDLLIGEYEDLYTGQPDDIELIKTWNRVEG